MAAYLLKRIAQGFLVLAGVSVVTFVIARTAPSNPAALWVGPRATTEQIEKAKIALGLDKPLIFQYQRYIRDIISGNWGVSIRSHQSVRTELSGFFAATMELTLAGIFIALIFAVPLGVIAAKKKESWIDKLIRLLSVSGVSIPVFWLAMLLQLIFFKELKIFPLGERVSTHISLMYPLEAGTGYFLLDSFLQGNWPFFKSALSHIILPAIVMAAYPLGLIIKMLRTSMIETLASEHSRFFTALGIGAPRRVFIYSLKNASPSSLTSLGIIFADSLTSSFLIESVFSWPGLGRWTSQAILSNDYPVTMAITFVVAFFFILSNIIVDMLLVVIDPRVKLT
ncbi:MAG: ABC transporter permease [Spirochaetaceae bacterium]|jgi:peptide/nickel transport system permease protein|nr:ABC transporter permease [Spirochaetaceae bacterium]